LFKEDAIKKKEKRKKKNIYLLTEAHVNQIKLRYVLEAGY